MARFASCDQQQINELLLSKDSNNTKKANLKTWRTFQAYLKEKNIAGVGEDGSSMLQFSDLDMDELLKRFYVEARKSNGELYKTTSLYSLRYGLNRYFVDLCLKVGIPRRFDFCDEKQFPNSTATFKACTKFLKKQGKGAIDSHPPIEEGDLRKMGQYFQDNIRDNPTVLQQKVFTDLMLQFGRRGRQNLRSLRYDSYLSS